jgi:hypothetical protein
MNVLQPLFFQLHTSDQLSHHSIHGILSFFGSGDCLFLAPDRLLPDPKDHYIPGKWGISVDAKFNVARIAVVVFNQFAYAGELQRLLVG